jgi:hypothetical protein
MIRFASLALFMVFAVSLTALAQDRPRLFKPKSQPAPVVVVAADPVPVQGLGDGKLRERIVLGIVKSRVLKKLETEGIDGKKYTRAEAIALYEKLTDDDIKGVVKEASPKTYAAIGEGGFLANLLQWIKDHPEEVAAIIKLILTLLALL